MFTYRSTEGACKALVPLPIRARLVRLAHEDMNPVMGWIEDKQFR